MVNCPNCGSDVGESNFCPNCGTKLSTDSNENDFVDNLINKSDDISGRLSSRLKKSKSIDSFFEKTSSTTFGMQKKILDNSANRTYWENQAKNAYNQLSVDQRNLIDKDNNGSFSLEEIRDYQNNNGLFGDGKLGANTLAKLTGNTKPTTGSGTEPTYGPV